MKLEDIEKLYSETTKGEWAYCYDGSSDYSLGLAPDPQEQRICGIYQRSCNIRDAEFMAVAHNIMPKLLAVAEAAKATLARQNDYQASWAMEDIRIALEELEKD